MILASLSESSLYEGLHPRFAKAFEYIKSHDLSKEAAGKIILDGDDLFISIAEITGKTQDAARTETHVKYIDIQVPLTAPETMGWIATDACTTVTDPYNADKDIAFFADKPTTWIELQPGEFAVFFPHDGHAPGVGSGAMKKAIVKVKI
jgi:YhcH/YjgK/YiaL family protein